MPVTPQSQEKPTEGVVVSMGPGKTHPETGVSVDLPCAVGDKVRCGGVLLVFVLAGGAVDATGPCTYTCIIYDCRALLPLFLAVVYRGALEERYIWGGGGRGGCSGCWSVRPNTYLTSQRTCLYWLWQWWRYFGGGEGR